MSRIGKKLITIPDKVQVTVNNGVISVKGPKGELSFPLNPEISFTLEGKELSFSRTTDEKHIRAAHGLTRAMVASMIQGVTNGFKKDLQMEGVGYKVELRGKNLYFTLGYSHPILFIPPPGIEFATTSATQLSVSGIDKQLVGEVAAKIRSLRPPEPYKGKGVRYVGEQILRKAGKSGKK